MLNIKKGDIVLLRDNSEGKVHKLFYSGGPYEFLLEFQDGETGLYTKEGFFYASKTESSKDVIEILSRKPKSPTKKFKKKLVKLLTLKDNS